MAQSNDYLKSHQIADILGAESTFVRKILARLAKAKLVETCGGRYGGYTLGKDPSEIRVGDIYRVLGTTPPTPHWSVPSTGSELFISLVVSKAEEEFQAVLDRYTIKDLVKQKSRL